MTDHFASIKSNPMLPPKPEGTRRIWCHLFQNQAALANWVGENGGKSADFNDPWEPAAYTNDTDDIFIGEYPAWRNALGIGTLKAEWHELRHIWLNGPDEDGIVNGNDEHHHFLKCSSWGLCVGAGHGVRFIDTHTGGVPKTLAVELLAKTRASEPDANGIKHGWAYALEADILKAQS